MNINMTNVHPGAKIGRDVVISPFTTIAEHVEIGDDCWIGPNVTIFDYTRIGRGCQVFPGAVLGGIPQDLKFQGEVSHKDFSHTDLTDHTDLISSFLSRIREICRRPT